MELAPELFKPLGEHESQVDPRGLSKAVKIYRNLAFKYHPDHGNDSRIMTDINEFWQAMQSKD